MLLFIAVIAGIMFGIPVAFALILVSSVGLLLGGINVAAISSLFIGGVDNWIWLAIPLFIMVGYLMNASGITDKMVLGARVFVGHLPGGLAHTAVGTSLIFSGVSGAMMADLTAMGVIFIPPMKKEGYPPAFAAALIGGASMLDPLIPPSIIFVTYGVMTGVSIGRLFLAGIVPGVLVALGLMLLIYLSSRKRKSPSSPRASPREMLRGVTVALPAIFLPVFVIGGMRLGYYTPTEAAGMALLYSALVGFFVYRGFSAKKLLEAFRETMKLSVGILFVIAASALFNAVLTYLGLITPVVTALVSISPHPLLLLLISSLVILVLGFMMDITVMVIILAPILSAVAIGLGIDPVHFAVVFCYAALLGALTPPYGIGMFALLRIANIKIGEYTREIIPVLACLLAILVLLILFPQISTFLPNLVYGG